MKHEVFQALLRLALPSRKNRGAAALLLAGHRTSMDESLHDRVFAELEQQEREHELNSLTQQPWFTVPNEGLGTC